MPTYTIDSAGSTLSATSGADSVFIQTGSLGATKIYALGGADTISIEGGANNAVQLAHTSMVVQALICSTSRVQPSAQATHPLLVVAALTPLFFQALPASQN